MPVGCQGLLGPSYSRRKSSDAGKMRFDSIETATIFKISLPKQISADSSGMNPC